MRSKYPTFVAMILLFSLLLPARSVSKESDAIKQGRLSEIIHKLGQLRDREAAEIQKYNAGMQKCQATINSSQNIIRKAREQGNVQAEQIAQRALSTAQEAKKKNEEMKRLAELNLKRADAALDYLRKGGADPEARLEQVEYDNMNDRWMQNQKQLIEQRLKDPNPYAIEIYRSLKTNAPPALPDRNYKYDNLKPGDVLLFHPDDIQSEAIKWGDRFSSLSLSPASHTVLYLKEVNGKKLFLDNTAGRGVHVISEDEFMRTYGKRDALVASLSQPIKQDEADKIWDAAKAAIKKEAADQQKKSGNIIDQTGYGLYGKDNMVCSEASRWALIKAGRDVPDTASPFKWHLGIHYGPANFYSDNQNFIITHLWAPEKK